VSVAEPSVSPHDRRDPIGVRIIVAVGRRGEVGLKGRLLFRLKADMQNFRAVTAGKPVVMGRKTWDSLPKRPLPGRPNIVVTQNPDFQAPGAFVFSSLPVALTAARAMAARMGVNEAFVLGGAAIWEGAMPYVTQITLTEADAEAEADTFFPKFDLRDWREISVRSYGADADNEADFVIRELVRR
jgi:dihydrofolate reductase